MPCSASGWCKTRRQGLPRHSLPHTGRTAPRGPKLRAYEVKREEESRSLYFFLLRPRASTNITIPYYHRLKLIYNTEI
eukprot:SAG11_NODE_16142_length_556_cov_0.505470_1_plen_77_part_10